MEANRALIARSRLQVAVRQVSAMSRRESEAFGSALGPASREAMTHLLQVHLEEVDSIEQMLMALELFEKRLPALRRAVLAPASGVQP